MFWTSFGISVVPILLLIIFNEYPVFGKKEQKPSVVNPEEDQKAITA